MLVGQVPLERGFVRCRRRLWVPVLVVLASACAAEEANTVQAGEAASQGVTEQAELEDSEPDASSVAEEAEPATTTSTTEAEPEPATTTSTTTAEPEPATTTSTTEAEPEPATTTSTTTAEPEPATTTSTTEAEPEPATTTSTTTAEPEPATTTSAAAEPELETAATTPAGANAAPTAELVPAQEVVTGESLIVNASSFFEDPDGDELVFEATSSNSAVATATVSGSRVSVSGIGEGTVMVTVAAHDPEGLSAERSFEVAVRHHWRVEFGLDPFHGKYRDAGGLPIVASAKVPDEALDQAKRLIDELLVNNPGVLAQLIAEDIRVAIMAAGSVVTDIPEFEDLYEEFPGVDWDERTRGGGLGPNPNNRAIAVAEENLLCSDTDVFPYEDVSLHEIAHGVLNMGVQLQPGGSEFRQRLERAYHDALARGLWAHTYSAVDPDEYWAEGVTSWFDLNGLPGPLDNGINTRSELKSYDPTLAGLVQEVFGDATITASCHPRADSPGHPRFRIQGVVVGPATTPLEGIGVWAWQGDAATSGYALTASDGTFFIAVSDGTFTLDVHLNPGDGCTLAGWHGPGGFTTDADSATRIQVDGANVEGITIKLPGQPDEVPYHELCS